ncbi:E2/UBC family protein [Mesorhizobium sp. M0060]|uniref:E2/UBC family protein n=1 Tax=Mesorhizobium sp. M0060 TaxID=2956866 RepID=UPI003337BFB5
MLPAIDQDYLQARAPGHSVSLDGGMIAIIIPSFPLPSGFTAVSADLLLRLSPGYPDVAPDMWWFEPAVRRTDGQVIEATHSQEAYLGRTWQRWSRHFQAGQWRSGIDSLESYLTLVKKELDVAGRARAA